MKAAQILSTFTLLFAAAQAVPVATNVDELSDLIQRAVEEGLASSGLLPDLAERAVDVDAVNVDAIDADASKKKDKKKGKKDPIKDPKKKFDFLDLPRRGTCGAQTFTKAEIHDAVDAAARLYNKGKAVGANEYPHDYRNRRPRTDEVEIRNFRAECAAGGLLEFPILRSHLVFNGGTLANDADRDRVVVTIADADKKGKIAVQFCGLMTHEGAPGGAFVQCTWEN